MKKRELWFGLGMIAGGTLFLLAALLLGGYWGGLAGAVGMTIGDLTTSYVLRLLRGPYRSRRRAGL